MSLSSVFLNMGSMSYNSSLVIQDPHGWHLTVSFQEVYSNVHPKINK